MRWLVLGFIAALLIIATMDFDGRGSYLSQIQEFAHRSAVLQDTATHNIHGAIKSLGPHQPFSGGR